MLLGSTEIAVTFAANSSSGSASTLIVAGWPTLIVPMSASLTETTICIELRSARTMKADPLEELRTSSTTTTSSSQPPVPRPGRYPRSPTRSPPLALERRVPLPAVTASPTAPEIDAIVPELGA